MRLGSTRRCGSSILLRMILLLLATTPVAASAGEIEWIVVGDPDNPGNFAGEGSVAVVYRVSKHEVTNSQYASFLNAVAATDPAGLYNVAMSQSSVGGIDRSGADGSHTYAAKPGFEDKPVNYVGWADAARFANWLHNGQPVGSQDPFSTEEGAYTIPAVAETVFRNPGAQYFLPDRHEWVKAGCYDPGMGSHWSYPTRTFGAPFCTDPPDPPAGPGVANCNDIVGSPTDVGAYSLSNSPYGTFDQAGNIAEYIEDQNFGASLGTIRGAYYSRSPVNCSSGSGLPQPFEASYTGFRIASVESPVGPPSLPTLGAAAGWLIAALGATAGCLLRARRDR